MKKSYSNISFNALQKEQTLTDIRISFLLDLADSNLVYNILSQGNLNKAPI